MSTTRATIEEVCDVLYDRFMPNHVRPPWLTALGLGMDNGKSCIFVYANNLTKAKQNIGPLLDANRNFQGHPVVFKKMGKLKPGGVLPPG